MTQCFIIHYHATYTRHYVKKRRNYNAIEESQSCKPAVMHRRILPEERGKKEMMRGKSERKRQRLRVKEEKTGARTSVFCIYNREYNDILSVLLSTHRYRYVHVGDFLSFAPPECPTVECIFPFSRRMTRSSRGNHFRTGSPTASNGTNASYCVIVYARVSGITGSDQERSIDRSRLEMVKGAKM